MGGFLNKMSKIKKVNEEKATSLAESKATAIKHQKEISDLLKNQKEIALQEANKQYNAEQSRMSAMAS